MDLLEGNVAAVLTRLEPWLDRASPYQRIATMLLPLLAWACSDLGDGLRSTALLAECREQIPLSYAEAKALAVYGDLLVARGHQSRARDQYAAALAILRSLGEVLYTKRIEQALVEMSHH
jgi:hypothetical protein